MAYWEYKDFVVDLAKKMRFKMPNTLEIAFFIKMPKSWSKKKRAEMDGRPHLQRPDLDNLIKAFKDALLEEDSQVFRYRDSFKLWSHTDKIEVTVKNGDYTVGRFCEEKSNKGS